MGINYAQGKIIRATEVVIGDVDGDSWNEVLFGTFDLDMAIQDLSGSGFSTIMVLFRLTPTLWWSTIILALPGHQPWPTSMAMVELKLRQ